MTYDEYIESIILERGQWGIPKGQYKEGHHIVPKCVGGTGNPKSKHHNIIWLYPREHYIAHKLLLDKYPNNPRIAAAFSMMAFPVGKTEREGMLTAEEYGDARRTISIHLTGENNPMYGKIPHNKGIPMSEEQKIKLSISMSGRYKGRIVSDETRSKMRESALNRDNSNNHSIKGRVAVSNGDCVKYIEAFEELPDGYYYGNCKTSGKHDLSRYYSNEEQRKNRSLKSSGANNPMYGNGYKISGGKNGKATYIYSFNNYQFDCRKDLLEYLHSIGIEASNHTIRMIMSNQYGQRIRKKYPDLVQNLSWTEKDENKIN